jgi:hypothetical protein
LGFPVKQDDKKVNRIQKKSNRAAKNLTGEQKILQDGIKMVLDFSKAQNFGKDYQLFFNG